LIAAQEDGLARPVRLLGDPTARCLDLASDNWRDQSAMRRRYSGVIISHFSSICCNATDKRPTALKIAGELSGKRHSVRRLYPMHVVTPNGTLGVSVIPYGIRDTSLTQMPLVAWLSQQGRYRITLKSQE
jgi:hypothetical protein